MGDNDSDSDGDDSVVNEADGRTDEREDGSGERMGGTEHGSGKGTDEGDDGSGSESGGEGEESDKDGTESGEHWKVTHEMLSDDEARRRWNSTRAASILRLASVCRHIFTFVLFLHSR